MVIKETPWEKRNLGVESSVEYYLEESDSASEIDTVTSDSTHEYQVAHVPVGKVEIIKSLLDSGFMFSETKFELIADLKELGLPKLFERFSDGMGYRPASKEDSDRIYETMLKGVFSTDKVALDPHFDARVAGRRYVFWTEDEVQAGRCYLFVVSQSGNDIGFFVLKKSNERLGDSFLAGLFDKEKYSGLGFSVLYYPMVEARRMGLKKMITGVSSNNPDSVKMHLALGYKIKNMDYTLVKHL